MSRRIATVLGVTSTVLVLASTSSPSDAGRGPCPSGMAHIADGTRPYCVDRYEGTVVELRGHEEVTHSPFDPVTNLKVKAVARAGGVPQGYISQLEAEAACKVAHKRLCTGEEWLFACRGKKPTTYPYGDEHKDGYCNDAGKAPVCALHPELTTDEVYASHDAMNDPRINRAPGTVAPSGRYAKCKNGYGVFDMVGNLHEWTVDVSNGHGIFRGGYFQDAHLNGDGCNYKTVAHDPSYHDYSTGFRCCADAK